MSRWPDDPMTRLSRFAGDLAKPNCCRKRQISKKANQISASPRPENRASQEVIVRDHGKKGVLTDEIVFGPKRHPGEKKQKHADLEAKYDVHDFQKALI